MIIQAKGKRGGTIIVDDDRTDLLKVSWNVDETGYPNGWYDGKVRRMHTLVVGDIPKGLYIDHINRNRLDNRRDNLRVVTPSQSNLNKRPRANTSSTYRGVSLDKRTKKWVAKFGKMWLGRHSTEESAALAYNSAALKFAPEYAILNEVQR